MAPDVSWSCIVPDEKVLLLLTIWALKPAKLTDAVEVNATTAARAATRPASPPVIFLEIGIVRKPPCWHFSTNCSVVWIVQSIQKT
jgi:hypothetical protein